MLAKLMALVRPKPVPVKPLCLCCYPQFHKNVNGNCIFDGRRWPCPYVGDN